MTAKLRVFLGATAAAILLDQATKQWVVHALTYADRIPIIPGFFSITYVRNPGAAFSLFASSPEPFRRVFFVAATVVAIALIVSFFRNLAPGDRLSALALGLILGGASGNLLDRLRVGEVVDFLHFRLWSGYAWPDFNIADSCIVVGVGLLILELFATEGESADAPRGSDGDLTAADPPGNSVHSSVSSAAPSGLSPDGKDDRA
jgi:signal peptidase II